MIELTRPVTAGRVNALFIGRDAEFAGESFQDQYESILGKIHGIEKLAYTDQVHGDRAHDISSPGQRLYFAGEGDALYSRERDTALLIRTADCVPILFYSETESLIGAVHAGWRGLEKRILTKTLGATGAGAKHLRFIVGPFIGKRSYEVGGDVAYRFSSAFSEPKSGGKFWLDLGEILRAELTDVGVTDAQVAWYDEDTLTANDWFSARRGDRGRNLSLIWLNAGK